MNNRSYYYLVAGLPDLTLEQSKLPFAPPEFIELLREMLHPDDFQSVEWLMYPIDHHNLLNLLQKKTSGWKPGGRFYREELEEKIAEQGQVQPYMERFYQAWRNESPIWSQMSWENQLARLYYEAGIKNAYGFLHDWLIFDQHLRNILAAWNIRTYQLPGEGQIVGQNEVTEAIEKSHARDFGLSGEWPLLDKLFHALEQEDLLEREKAIDRIRWSYIDELNTFHYFDIDVILGYLLKLVILDRWTGLDAEKGKTAIDNLLRDLEIAFEFPAKFS